MTERVPRLFVTALADLTQWLETAGVPAMIVGGIAASILRNSRSPSTSDSPKAGRKRNHGKKKDSKP